MVNKMQSSWVFVMEVEFEKHFEDEFLKKNEKSSRWRRRGVQFQPLYRDVKKVCLKKNRCEKFSNWSAGGPKDTITDFSDIYESYLKN